jgi:phage replication-related protein YjqB (UPF0714/DUF867 family)
MTFLSRLRNSFKPQSRRDAYDSFEALALHHTQGVDYGITVNDLQSTTTVIVPHGGKIESHTSEIGREIAGRDFNFYAFEGLRGSRNYDLLHITSERFNEPHCIQLVARSRTVVAIHGCDGETPIIHIGGRDDGLIRELSRAFDSSDIPYTIGNPRFPGQSPTNICNRGTTGMGVQLELSRAVRSGPVALSVIRSVRTVLLNHLGTETGIQSST